VIAPSRELRRTAIHPTERRDGRPLLFGWGQRLSRAEKERAKIRLAFVALSSVLGFVALLIGGTLFWDKVVLAQRPVLRIDGQTFSLRHYANLLSYKQNVLDAEYQQALQLASQPAPAGMDPSQGNPFAQFAQQRLAQIDNQRAALPQQLVEDMISATLIRGEAAERNLTATPDEVEAELEKLVGYQDPNATPVPTTTVPTTTPATPDAPPAAGADAADATAAPATAVPSPAPTTAPTAVVTRTAAESFESLYRDYQRVTAGTDAIIRQDVQDQILRRKLSEALASAVGPTAEQIHARHILVPDETAAQAVLARLRAGESFEALAAELSTDSSNKDNGGDLSWFPRGEMVSEFEDAAFKLQPGQLSEPVKTQFGVHIIRVDERDSSRALEPDQLENLKASALSKWLEAEEEQHRIARLLSPDMIEWAQRNGRRPSTPLRG
jgi:parvulin-like peptidyl-prolyl isomerase